MAKVNFKITVGVKERAEIRDICKGIKENSAHYETVKLTNRDASAHLKVRFQRGKLATYAAEIKTIIDCEVVAIDWLESNSFNDIENFIRTTGTVESINADYEKFLKQDLDDAEISEIDAMIESRKTEKTAAKREAPTDPLDIVLMDSLLLVRKGNGILKPGQVLDLRGAFSSKNGGNITVDVNVNNMIHDELQYCGSQFYTLGALSVAIGCGDLAVITHSAPLKECRVYDARGEFYTTQINPQSRLTTVTINFIKHGSADKITFHPVLNK